MTIPRDVARTEVLANLDLQTKVIVACALLVLCLCTVSKVRDRIFQNFFNFCVISLKTRLRPYKVITFFRGFYNC